jgi:hypothetical protein
MPMKRPTPACTCSNRGRAHNPACACAEDAGKLIVQDIVHVYPDTAWAAAEQGAPTHDVEAVLEAGGVLMFPYLPFVLSDAERPFLDPRFADGKAKNISVRAGSGELRGAVGTADQKAALQAMVQRFQQQAEALVDRLFPHYRGQLTRGNASFRPMAVAGRQTSWRKDDTRLHTDAFPSNPMQGVRLLRVFTNLNPHGQPREWRVGEPFEDFARRHVPAIAAPLPGSAWLLRSLRITKSKRSAYDHYMLQLHDRAKADTAWQQSAPQQAVNFAPGTTWVVFSDQVLHAVMGGQYMMEHTLYLPPGKLRHPERAPLAVLERLVGKPLLERRA